MLVDYKYDTLLKQAEEEVQTMDFNRLAKIGLELDPKDFDFVYGYPPLTSLKPVGSNEKNFIVNRETLGLYIHIPFCVKLCRFCYFVKQTGKNPEYVDRYVKAVLKEIRLYARQLTGSTLKYCYIGGGTPTFLTGQQLEAISSELYENFCIAPDFEFTCEASPETIDEHKLKTIKNAGINRVSVGIQSFNDEVTEHMNRAHDREQSIRTIDLLKKHFGYRFNIDIIYGYPESNEYYLLEDIDLSNNLDIPSITFYQIWLRVFTPTKKQAQEQTKEDIFKQKFLIKNRMTEYGYFRNMSDWYLKDSSAKFSFQEHKWQNKDFIGIGVSSYAYSNNYYYRNFTKIPDYLNTVERGELGIGHTLFLKEEENLRRACALGIKTQKGIDSDYINTINRKNYSILFQTINTLFYNGLIKQDNQGNVKLTERGFLMPDDISELFFKKHHNKTLVFNA